MPTIHLLIIGHGLQRKSFFRRIEHLGCSSFVSYLGECSREELANYYNAADLFVFPSISDTQAIVLYEALSEKLPIVAVQSIAAYNAIEESKNGMIVPLDVREFSNAVLKCLSSQNLLNPSLKDRYSIENTISKHFNLYEQIVYDFEKLHATKSC